MKTMLIKSDCGKFKSVLTEFGFEGQTYNANGSISQSGDIKGVDINGNGIDGNHRQIARKHPLLAAAAIAAVRTAKSAATEADWATL